MLQLRKASANHTLSLSQLTNIYITQLYFVELHPSALPAPLTEKRMNGNEPKKHHEYRVAIQPCIPQEGFP